MTGTPSASDATTGDKALAFGPCRHTCPATEPGLVSCPAGMSDSLAAPYDATSDSFKGSTHTIGDCSCPEGEYAKGSMNSDFYSEGFSDVGLRNAGLDCWAACGDRGGRCLGTQGFCGTGMCCRMGSVEGGCDGLRGGATNHQCVASRCCPSCRFATACRRRHACACFKCASVCPIARHTPVRDLCARGSRRALVLLCSVC